jgi:hypothetical protein
VIEAGDELFFITAISAEDQLRAVLRPGHRTRRPAVDDDEDDDGLLS